VNGALNKDGNGRCPFEGRINSGCQVARATEFCMVMPNMCG
jgi:hypothetical protein